MSLILQFSNSLANKWKTDLELCLVVCIGVECGNRNRRRDWFLASHLKGVCYFNILGSSLEKARQGGRAAAPWLGAVA